MEYLFLISLILVLATILTLSMQYDYKRIKKKCDQAIIEAKAWGKADWKGTR